MILLPLFLLHLRRNRRRDITVSSVLLWGFALENPESPLRRRLKESLHLILQLLIISSLILAAANPMLPRTAAPRGDRIILILDGSASMTAGEGRENRFTLATSEAEKAVRRAGGREMAIILAGTQPRLLSGFTSSRRQLTAALGSARPVAGEADMDACFSLASNLSEGGGAEIILISDGGFSSPSVILSRPLTFIPVGKDAGNLGITAFNARRDPDVTGRHHIFAAVQNSSELDETRLLSLTLEGKVIETREVVLPPGKEVQQVFILDGGAGRLEIELSGTDDFPMDDRAVMVIKDSRPLQVLLVSGGNYYLETLLGLMPGIKLSVLERYPVGIFFDLVVFESPPPDVLPPGNYLFLGIPYPDFSVDLGSTVNFPGVSGWESSHPVMIGVDPRSFTIYQAKRPVISLPGRGRAETVLKGEVPLIITFDDELSRAVFFTFPLRSSDLPLRAAFPLLMSNILEWLNPAYNPHPYDSRRGGQLVTFSDTSISGRLGKASGISEPLTLIRPDGSDEKIIPVDGEYRFFPMDTGFYSMTLAGTEHSWAVNLLSSEESDLSRRWEAPVPASGLPAAISPSQPDLRQNGEGDFHNLWPWLLLAGGLLLLAERLLARMGLPGAGERGRAELILTALAAALIIGAALNPVLPLGKTALSVIYLLDSSHSILPGDRDAALDWIQRSGANGGALDRTALITFGADALISAAPSPELPELEIDTLPEGGETNPSNAVRRALSLLPGTGDRRIILLSDGNETSGDLLELLSSLSSPGLRLFSLPMGKRQTGSEILIRSLTGPGRSSAGELFSLTMEVESSGAGTGEVFFYLDGQYYGEDDIEFSRGSNQFVYKMRLEEHGFHLVEAVIYSESDYWYENNRFQKVIFTEGESPLLYLYGRRGPSESLISILEDQEYSLDIRPAAGFPSSLRELFSYRAAILDNVSAFELTFTEMELLKNAAAGGLGILVSGGDSSFGLGGYYKTPIESFLPVDVDVTSSMDLPDVAILMIIDKSGTMQEGAGEDDQGRSRYKIDLAKQAVLSAVEVLEPNHQAAILSFDAGWEWTLPFTGAGEIESIREQLSSLQPGGGTVLYPVLEEAHRVLSAHSAAVKHLLILSDGHTDERDFQLLAEKMRADGITISTVAVGSGSDRTLMENLARWGEGRAYYAEDIQSVPAIFADESLKASKRLAVEETFFPVLLPGHAVLQGLRQEDIPPLEGFLLSYLKPEAELLMEGVEGNPLLAVKQYGLGRTAAFTSSLDSTWTAAWNSWEDYSRLFSQLIRWLSRGNPETGITFSLSRSRRGGDIRVNAVIPGEGFINNLALTARVITPELKEIEIPLNQSGPGLYQGRFPLSREGNYFVTLLKDDRLVSTTITGEQDSFGITSPVESQAQAQGTAVFSLPYADEFRRIASSEGFLEEAARLTGGRMLSPDAPLPPEFFIPNPDLRSHPLSLRPFFILTAVALFLAALFFRLLPSGFFRIAASRVRNLALRFGGSKGGDDYLEIKAKMEEEKKRKSEPLRDEDFWFGRH